MSNVFQNCQEGIEHAAWAACARSATVEQPIYYIANT